MSSSLSTAVTSPSPSPSTPLSPGNATDTLDNIIVSPKLGASLLYGNPISVEWNATTNGDTSVFYRSLLPSPSSDIAIPTCQNLQSIPGTVMACPWPVLPSSLPPVANQGFEIVLSWNGSTQGSTSGTQVSPQFGIYNGTIPTTPATTYSVPTQTISITSSAFASGAITPTASTLPNSVAQAEHAMSEKIGLGVGLGVGIPLIALLFATCFLLRRRRARVDAGNSAEQPQEDVDLPAWRSTRLAKAIFSSDNKSLGAAELLENYRNAEHFGFIPSSPSR